MPCRTGTENTFLVVATSYPILVMQTAATLSWNRRGDLLGLCVGSRYVFKFMCCAQDANMWCLVVIFLLAMSTTGEH